MSAIMSTIMSTIMSAYRSSFLSTYNSRANFKSNSGTIVRSYRSWRYCVTKRKPHLNSFMSTIISTNYCAIMSTHNITIM